MLAEHFELIENVALDLLIAGLFFFIGMAIRDVLKQGKVPLLGRIVVWSVLTLGCIGFIIKGLIELYWRSSGL